MQHNFCYMNMMSRRWRAHRSNGVTPTCLRANMKQVGLVPCKWWASKPNLVFGDNLSYKNWLHTRMHHHTFDFPSMHAYNRKHVYGAPTSCSLPFGELCGSFRSPAKLRALHTLDWGPVTIALQVLSLVEKVEPVQVRFTLRLRDQHSK